MSDIQKSHSPELAHHVNQGAAWLAESAKGENTAALSYAALEFRFAIERLGVHYLTTLSRDGEQQVNLEGSWKFDSVRRNILQRAGNQQVINRQFEFMRIMLRAIKVEGPLHAPQFGTLQTYWGECSEICHIEGALSCAVPEFRKQVFDRLTDISSLLFQLASSVGWPNLNEQNICDLRDRFCRGEATVEQVQSYLEQVGLWGKIEYPDARPAEFVGQPLPPNNDSAGLLVMHSRAQSAEPITYGKPSNTQP